jgi:hypothetical protein
MWVKKIYEVDPLICPECVGPMRIISFIEEEDVIGQILEHLKLWEDPEPRPLPAVPEQVFGPHVGWTCRPEFPLTSIAGGCRLLNPLEGGIP